MIGCGGISSGADALEFAASGATLVQLYTSFGYGGVGTPRRVKDEILAGLGTSTWGDVVKASVSTLSLKAPTPPITGQDLLKHQADELKAVLDSAAQQIAFGDDVITLDGKLEGLADIPKASIVHKVGEYEVGAKDSVESAKNVVEELKESLAHLDGKSVLEDTGKTLKELIAEAEKVLAATTEGERPVTTE